MVVMGLDIGYSNLKVVISDGIGQPRSLLYPAGAAPVDRMPERIGREDEAVRVQVDGETYVACIGAERLQDWSRVLHEDYPGTASYRALYYAALLLAEQEGIDRVVTGLPVSQYLNRQRREALTKALGGEHRVTPRRTVRVRDTQVIPQPVGGYMDLVWSHDNLDLLDEARVLVIDPGFFSVDWVLVVSGEVRTRSSGTSHQAASVLLEEAGRLIGDEHGGRPGRERLENALRRGQNQVLLFGQPVAIRPTWRRPPDGPCPSP